jgi:hypothetical protein
VTKTIYLTYQEFGVLVNAVSVTLASDPLAGPVYGIKRHDTGAIAVPDGTSVSNIATGRYQYDFDPIPGVIYTVSWKIVGNDASVKYITQEIGPFVDATKTFSAVTSYEGLFWQGNAGSLMLKITDFDGSPINAEAISLSITDSNGVSAILYNLAHTLVTSVIPETATDGFYVYDWYVDPTQAIGEYFATWTYLVDGVTSVITQEVTVQIATNAISPASYNGRIFAIRSVLDYYISCAQNIPVYNEQAKPSHDYQTYYFTFPRWNMMPDTRIFRNDTIMQDGFTIDWFKGRVIFDTQCIPEDRINASYNFRWFSDEELNAFIFNAIMAFNTYPPHSGYNPNSIPDRFLPGVLYKAAVDALRKLMMCLQFQQPAQVFGGREAADKVFSNIETLKRNYEEDANKLWEMKKLGPYIGLTQSVIVPEYTLPGGRSRWFRMLMSGSSAAG